MAELTPRLGVKDLDREVKFFEAIGFEVTERSATGAMLAYNGITFQLDQYEAMRVSDAPLLDWDRSPAQMGVGLQLYIFISSVDALAERIPVGVPRPWPLQDKSWGLRELTLRTPSGHLITFATRR